MTYTFTETLVGMCCGQCGISFAVPQSFHEEQKKLGPKGGWYCPNGHSRCFSKSKITELEERNTALSLIIDRQRDTIQSKDHVIRATRAAKTRLKNRVAAGVCPCCNRTFSNLAAHFKNMHPEESSAMIELPSIHKKINAKSK